jgi:hypothetical protein
LAPHRREEEILFPLYLRRAGLLHDHMRVERVLFEEIERIVPAAELERVRL